MHSQYSAASTEVPNLAEVRSYFSEQAMKLELVQAVDSINKVIAPKLEALRFKMEEPYDEVMLVDIHTDIVLRHIPNYEVLCISKTLERLNQLHTH